MNEADSHQSGQAAGQEHNPDETEQKSDPQGRVRKQLVEAIHVSEERRIPENPAQPSHPRRRLGE
jgi:hypothetical protein